MDCSCASGLLYTPRHTLHLRMYVVFIIIAFTMALLRRNSYVVYVRRRIFKASPHVYYHNPGVHDRCNDCRNGWIRRHVAALDSILIVCARNCRMRMRKSSASWCACLGLLYLPSPLAPLPPPPEGIFKVIVLVGNFTFEARWYSLTEAMNYIPAE